MFLLPVSLVLFGCEASQPAFTSDINLNAIMDRANSINAVSYDMTMILTSTDQNSAEDSMTGTGKSYKNGNKFRIENSIDGMTSILIAPGNGELWSLDPDAKTAYKMPDEDLTTKLATDWAKENPENITVMDEETLNGYECVVIKIGEDTDVNGVNYTMWISIDTGVPLKIETTLPGGNSLLLMENVDMETPPDNLFVIPDEYEIIETSFAPVN
jgi:outer membrane lipoprotein-sorting protein